jgi:DNA-binding XRE family transcriptional regulator
MTAQQSAPDPWDFENEEQRDKMLQPITDENCWEKLKLIRDVSGLSRRDLAKVIGVAESTILRLESKKTKPSADFMLRLGALCAIGHAKYSKLTEEEKEKISGYLGAGGGIAAGIGGALGAVSVTGTVAGLSAAGVTSGLAALGGGAMLGGLAVVAAIPIAAGAAGYGLVKAIKYICEANSLDCKEIDDHWEIRHSAIS